MRHLGIVPFAALLLALSTSTPADSPNDEALAIAHLAFRDHIVTITSSAVSSKSRNSHSSLNSAPFSWASGLI